MNSQRILDDGEVCKETIKDVQQKLSEAELALTKKITPAGKEEYRQLREKLSLLEGSHAW